MLAARLRAYIPGGAALQQMPQPLQWSAMVARNDVGSLTLTYSSVAAGGEVVERALTDGVEIALEVTDGEVDAFGVTVWTEPRGCRFVMIERGRDIADPTKSVSLTLPSYAWLLSKARNYTTDVYPPEHAQAGKRGWVDPTAGEILADLLTENTARGGYAAQVAPVFDAVDDAASDAWPTIPSQAFDLGTDYASILDSLTAAGALDWQTQARGLYAWLPDSTALSPDLSTGDAPLTLRPKHVAAMPTSESIAEMVGRMYVRTDAGGVAVAEDPAVVGPWGTPEGFLQVGSVADESAAVAVGEAELERVGKVRGQYTRDLVLTDDAPAPLLDYWPGCWIKAPGAGGASERLRVQSVTLTKDANGLGGSAVLNDRIVADDERRARNLSALAGGGNISAGGPPAPIAVDPEASRVPSTPTGLDATAALTFTGPTPRGVVTATWDVVTTATDTGALTISGYELQWRIGAGAWQTIPTPELSAQIADQTPGDSIDTRVRAVGARTTLPSAWSATDTVVVPGDVTAPSTPTGLTVTSALMIVSATWAGTPTMPADFARVEVYADTTAAPTTLRGTLARAGTLQITAQTLGAPIGDTVYVRLRAFDTTGNASAYTADVSVVVVGVDGPDLEADSVTANTIAVGALDGFLITGSTVRTSATNPRVEMDNTGLYAYDSGGTATVSIVGGTASITGGTITGATVRTAASGDRLEMTTAGLTAWQSGAEAVEFLPGGVYVRDGGEFVTEWASGNEAVYIGSLPPDGGPPIRGVRMRNPDGVLLFSLESQDDSAWDALNLSSLNRVQIGAATVQVITNDEVSLITAGGTGDYTGSLLLNASGAHLRGGVATDAEITVDSTSIVEEYASSWRVLPSGTPTWAGGPGSGTIAILANNSGVSLAYQSTTSSANLFLTTAGTVQRSTSSLRYKRDVEDLDVTVAQVLALRPVTWRDRVEVETDPDTEHRIPGFIAEEVHALGLTQFVVYDEEGRPDALQSDRISAAQQLVLVDHEARLTDALTRLAALETP
jgi:hypothetical protein